MLHITDLPNELDPQEQSEAPAPQKAPIPGSNPKHQGTDPDNPDFHDSDAGGAEPAPKPEVQEEIPEWQKQKHKVKIDDEEREVDYDELKRGYQRMQAAQKRFMEASKLQKEAEAKMERVSNFVNQLNENPEQLLAKMLGQDRFREIAERAVWNQIQREQSLEGVPEHIRKQLQELEQLKARDQEWKQREEQEQKTREQQKREAEVAQHRQRLEQEITAGLQQYGADLPRTPETLRRAAFYLHSAKVNGIPADMRDIAEQVRESYIEEHKSLIAKMEPEQLYRLFGEDVAKKIRQHDLGRLKNPTPNRQLVDQQPTESSKKDKRKYLTWDEFSRRTR